MTWLPFDLHPEIADEGVAVSEGRAQRYQETFAPMCEEAGLPFAVPRHTPRTLPSLEAAEWVRQTHPDAFPAFHRALFTAHWSQGRDIGSIDELCEIAEASGSPAGELPAALSSGSMRTAIRESMQLAVECGVTGTPAWLIGRLLIPGAQPREVFDRLIDQMRARGTLPG